MDYVKVVGDVARELKLLGEGGRFKNLDSLTILDLVLALERATHVKMPRARMRKSSFDTVENVAAVLEQAARG